MMAMQKIMIIRHAEKPIPTEAAQGVGLLGDQDDESLIPRGWQRAGALVRLLAPLASEQCRSGLARPEKIFAARADPGAEDSSKRPGQTVAPLAQFLDQPVNDTYGKADVEEAAQSIIRAAGIVLVSWEHKMIPDLITRIAGTAPAGKWPGGRFDMVVVLDHAKNGWMLTQVPQLLLEGDVADALW